MTVAVAKKRAWVPSKTKVLGGVAWFGGVWTTALFLASFADLESLTLLGVAMVVQLMFTAMELSFWKGDRSSITVAVLIADTAINAAGLWPMLQRIDQSNLWWFLIDVTGLSPVMSPVVGGGIACAIGFLLAAAPEFIWRSEKKAGPA
jgi:hypothetical protein